MKRWLLHNVAVINPMDWHEKTREITASGLEREHFYILCRVGEYENQMIELFNEC